MKVKSEDSGLPPGWTLADWESYRKNVLNRDNDPEEIESKLSRLSTFVDKFAEFLEKTRKVDG